MLLEEPGNIRLGNSLIFDLEFDLLIPEHLKIGESVCKFRSGRDLEICTCFLFPKLVSDLASVFSHVLLMYYAYNQSAFCAVKVIIIIVTSLDLFAIEVPGDFWDWITFDPAYKFSLYAFDSCGIWQTWCELSGAFLLPLIKIWQYITP